MDNSWGQRQVVYAKRPFGGPEAVLAYLSRYTSNSHFDGDGDVEVGVTD